MRHLERFVVKGYWVFHVSLLKSQDFVGLICLLSVCSGFATMWMRRRKILLEQRRKKEGLELRVTGLSTFLY